MWKDYLSFTRQEQKGLIFLASLIVCLVLYRLFVPLFVSAPQVYVSKEDSLFINQDFPKHEYNSNELEHIPYFNPNKVSYQFLIDIGVDVRVANNWINYLKKGGLFKEVDDVSRIYGMDSVLLIELKPYMFLPLESNRPATQVYHQQVNSLMIDLNKLDVKKLQLYGWSDVMVDSFKSITENFWFKERLPEYRIKNWNSDTLLTIKSLLVPKMVRKSNDDFFVLEINSADTSQWLLLKGIGPVLSRRIVAYRKKLGGFITPDQLIEVYGISPVLVENIKPYLTVDSLKLSKLDINRASIRQLRNHPYMGFYKAQALIEERRKRGRFYCATELLDLSIFNDPEWEKLKHYLAAK